MWRSESARVRLAAVASAASAWYVEARYRVQVAACVRGRQLPSRAHRTFVCPATEDLREGLGPPVTRVHERLLAIEEAEEEPSPPIVTIVLAAVERFLRSSLRMGPLQEGQL